MATGNAPSVQTAAAGTTPQTTQPTPQTAMAIAAPAAEPPPPLEHICTVVLSSTRHAFGTWCMRIETASEVGWNVREQRWSVTFRVWTALNVEQFPTEMLRYVAYCEEQLLDALCVPAALLVEHGSATNTMVSYAGRPEDVMLCYAWYRLRGASCLECTVDHGPFGSGGPKSTQARAFTVRGTDKDVFLRIVSSDCKDAVLQHTLRTATVRNLDLWRKAISNPFLEGSDLLGRVACIVSQHESFVDYLRFLRTTRVAYTTRLSQFVRYGWALCVIERAAKERRGRSGRFVA